MKSEKTALLHTLDITDDTSISSVKKQIVTMKMALKSLDDLAFEDLAFQVEIGGYKFMIAAM